MILISVVAVISLIAILVSRQTEQRGAVEFFGAADESSNLHAGASVELESALASIGDVDRQDLRRRLQGVSDTAAEAHALLAVDVPPTIGTSYGTMTTASSTWTDGSSEVSRTIVAIMDGVLVDGAQSQLEAALDLLRVGDASYALFLDSLSSAPAETEIPIFTSVTYINPDAQPLLYDAQTLVLRIQASYDLSPQHDVAVSGMTIPEPVGESGGTPVVPFSPGLDIQAVVSNVGNEDEPTVVVDLELFSSETGSTVSASQTIVDLAAGSSTSVTFADVSIVPGGLYQAKVTVTIPEDIDLENNVWEMTFIWRSES